ncbi:hypothetical protein [Geodermatophilus sp. SYSU D01176]
MNADLFDQLCHELGHDPASVLVIRVTAREVSVTYTEPSGMPRGNVHRLERGMAQGLRGAI